MYSSSVVPNVPCALGQTMWTCISDFYLIKQKDGDYHLGTFSLPRGVLCFLISELAMSLEYKFQSA